MISRIIFRLRDIKKAGEFFWTSSQKNLKACLLDEKRNSTSCFHIMATARATFFLFSFTKQVSLASSIVSKSNCLDSSSSVCKRPTLAPFFRSMRFKCCRLALK